MAQIFFSGGVTNSEVMSKCERACCNFCRKSIQDTCCPQEIQKKSTQGLNQKEISNGQNECLSPLKKNEPLPKPGNSKIIPGISRKMNQKNKIHNKISSSQHSFQDGHDCFYSIFPQNRCTLQDLLQKPTSVCQHCTQYVPLQNYQPNSNFVTMCVQPFHPISNYLSCVTIQPINFPSIFPYMTLNNYHFTSYYPKIYQATCLPQPQWQSMFCNGWYPMQSLQDKSSAKEQQYRETINTNETGQMNHLACMHNQKIKCKINTPPKKEKGLSNPENKGVNIDEYNFPEMDNISDSSIPLFFDDAITPYSTSESGIYEDMEFSNSPCWKTIDEVSDLEERQEGTDIEENQILNKCSKHIRKSSGKKRESDTKTNVPQADSTNLFIKSKICEENISLTHVNTQNAKFKSTTNLKNTFPMVTKYETDKGFRKNKNMEFSNQKLPLQMEDVIQKGEICNKSIELPINKQKDLSDLKFIGRFEEKQQTFHSDKNTRSTRNCTYQIRKHTPTLQIENMLMNEEKMRHQSIIPNNTLTVEETASGKQLEKNDALENNIHNKKDWFFNHNGHKGDTETTDIIKHAESQFSNVTGNKKNKQNKSKKSKNKKEANQG